ncbi:MAG: lipid IV(A) 3-deoxy-D-manno-octulosonic acid transferase [Cocleimonas sp.]
MSLRRALYSLLLYLIFPLVIFRLFWRSRSNPEYRQRIGERLGFVQPDSDKPVIWVHAVSVGETIAAQPLIEGLIKQYSDHRILVTTTTPTGSDRVKALFGDRVAHVYFPYDLPDVVARFINRIKPKMLIVIETEIWANLFAKCKKENIPLALVNARLSMRSTQKYQKISKLIDETLANISLIAVRSKVDAERFKALGANDEQIVVAGNIKFDFQVNEKQVAQGKQWRRYWGANLVWVAASTHAGEDEKILDIHQNVLKQFPNLMLVLVPRHPERFDEVFALCNNLEEKGIKTLRHSQVDDYTNAKATIILGDSMGEMQSWFAVADVVFMGGSLVETGGHNPIEPIAQGVPVVSGPHLYNFDDVAPQLEEEGLLFIGNSKGDVEEQISQWLMKASRKETSKFKVKAQQYMQQHQGVTTRLLDKLSILLG